MIDPKISLYIGIAVTIEQAIGIGALNLTDAIPLAYIPAVKSWCLILAFTGTAILTAHIGAASTDDAKLKSVEAMDGMKELVPETGATGAIAAAVADPNRPKVIDANPAPPSGTGKPANPT